VIVSHRYRFVFIKTYKTAGTSLELTLGSLCGADDVITPLDNHPLDDQVDLTDHHPRNYGEWSYNHMSARAVKARIGPAIWANYFTFAVERNPWDKALSFHAMVTQRRGPLSFDRFLHTDGLHGENAPLYTDNKGAVMVARVLRYEKLDQELAEVFAHLNVPWTGLKIRARSGNRADKRPYHAVYSTAQRQRVATLFQKEIDLWGYSFDGSSEPAKP